MGVSPIRWLYEPEAPPVKETGVESPPMSNLALRLHGRDAHAPFLMWAGRPRSLNAVGGDGVPGGGGAKRGARHVASGNILSFLSNPRAERGWSGNNKGGPFARRRPLP
jgi:hypothetical protein